MASYITKDYDLAAATTDPTLIAETRGKAVVQVQVLDCTIGAQFFIRIGEGNPRIILATNRSFNCCPPEVNGVFYENPIAGVGNVTLLISFDDGAQASLTVGP